MLRRGWSTVQVPDGWLQLIRGPRPQSVKWPTKGHPRQQRGVVEGLRMAAHSQVSVATTGRSCLQRTSTNGKVGGGPWQLWRVRPNIPVTFGGVEEGEVSDPKCIRWTSVLHQREPSWNVHRRGLDLCREEGPCTGGSDAGSSVVAITSKPWSKAKLVWPHSRPKQWRRGRTFFQLCQPTLHELAELRACVQELRRENTNLRSELQRTEQSGRERDRKQARVCRFPLWIWSL